MVSALVPITEEPKIPQHLDLSGESGYVMARLVKQEMVCSVLGQHCHSKKHPSLRTPLLPYPKPVYGVVCFPLSQQG